MKKRISMAIAVATAAATMASVSVPVMADDVNITIFNSKMEVQSQFEELAAQYAEETGVGVEVYYNSDTVSAHLATRYSANDPYTISMVDPKDIYSLAADHAIDLSDQSWVNETDYAIGVDGQINGFPTCLEARGVIYNADAIEAITGCSPQNIHCHCTSFGMPDTLPMSGIPHPSPVPEIPPQKVPSYRCHADRIWWHLLLLLAERNLLLSRWCSLQSASLRWHLLPPAWKILLSDSVPAPIPQNVCQRE